MHSTLHQPVEPKSKIVCSYINEPQFCCAQQRVFLWTLPILVFISCLFFQQPVTWTLKSWLHFILNTSQSLIITMVYCIVVKFLTVTSFRVSHTSTSFDKLCMWTLNSTRLLVRSNTQYKQWSFSYSLPVVLRMKTSNSPTGSVEIVFTYAP